MANTTIGTIELIAKIDTAQYTAGAATIDSANKKIESSANQTEAKSNKSFNGIAKVGLAAVAAGAVAAGVAISKNLGGAVDRIDSLVSFPRVLASMGQPLDAARSATQQLSDSLQGLPTALDEGTRGVQQFVAAGLDAGQATNLFLAMNNALLAGGANAQDAQIAFDGMQRAISSGEVPTSTLTAMLSRMPTVMAALTGATGKSRDELQKLYSQDPQQLIDHIIRLNQEGGGGMASLEQQARDATGGIGSSFMNMSNSINRGMQAIVTSIGGGDLEAGQRMISNTINTIGKTFENALRVIAEGISWIQSNASWVIPVVSGLAAATVAVVTLGTAMFIGAKAVAVFGAALTFLAAHPVVATLSIIVGLIAAIAVASGMKNFKKSLDDSSKAAAGVSGNLGKAGKNLGGATKEAQKLSKELAKIDRETAKVNENFREQLAELVFNKNETIKQLREQLAEEKAEYDSSYRDRLSSFQQTQQQEAATHQQKVNRLTTQIDFLRKYQNASNQQQLTNLQFALARENALYTQQVTERQTKYDQDAENERLSYEKRRQELQTRLNNETSLLERHRADVDSIRNVMLLDEIDKLKRSRNEQLTNLDQQRRDALSNAASTASGVANAFGSPAIKGKYGDIGNEMGTEMGKALINAFINEIKNLPRRLWEESKPGGSIDRMFDSWFGSNSALGRAFSSGMSRRGFATGGFTGRGGINEPAGIVHRGEYVLPQSMVNQSTGLPDLDKFMGQVNNGYVNEQPTIVRFAPSPSILREAAIYTIDLLNQDRRAKGLPEIGVA